MEQLFRQFFINLYNDTPLEFYIGFLSVLCIGSIIIISKYGAKNGWRKIAGLLLVEYVVLVYCSTVVLRPSNSEYGYDYTPFWSYKIILKGENPILFPENVMNVVAFVPFGMLIGLICREIKWWQVLLLGFGLSLSIEILQLVLKRGFSELDDVIHNSIGCIVGYGLYQMARIARLKIRGKI